MLCLVLYNSTAIESMKEGSLALNGIEQPPAALSSLASRLKVLAEPRRLRIVHMLMEGVQCNCELGDALEMAPNLISHHLRVLREAGLVDVERDPDDGRWVYYSLNREALDELNRTFGQFFDPSRIKPRRQTCGPQGAVIGSDSIVVQAR
jgi:ArsR family transcriptional regulator